MDPLLATAIPRLLEALRHELHQYGEMLALLDRQQEAVMLRAADDVLQSVNSINDHLAQVAAARLDRESCQQQIATLLRQPAAVNFADWLALLPAKFQPAVEALVRENNELLVRVQQRARQNHLLLSRSVELMQRFLHALIPACQPTTYNGAGGVELVAPQPQPLYEAVG
jgi:flagellar biosynthesis/type III secretory pathway chaperone